MLYSSWLLLLIPTFASASALPQTNINQNLRKRNDNNAYITDDQRAEAVKEAFRHAWKGYKQYAFPHDELRPLTNSYGDSRNGWGASAVDALSTAIIMQEKDIVNDILRFIPTIDWKKTNTQVSLFETTIRYIGGLISAYDLLTDVAKDLVDDPNLVQDLIKQAKSLADTMKYAFNTPTGIPYNDLVFPISAVDSKTNGLATAGSLVLEWTRLSDILKQPIYGQLAQRAQKYLMNPIPKSTEAFPGLVGSDINIADGTFDNDHGSWSGGADSFYEYLLKMYVYDPSRFGQYRQRYEAAADSALKYLRSEVRPGGPVFLQQWNGNKPYNMSQHLTCFDGGSFLLAGQVLNRKDYTNFGLELTAGCHETYSKSLTNIGPDSFGWDENRVPYGFQDFYKQNGWYPLNSGYYLRPEVMESFYYAYRATNDSKYKDWSWDSFIAINETCRTTTGFTEISNVNLPGGGMKGDNQESFLFAEVLKYLYIIHSQDADWQVSSPGKPQKYVYNTEAHPFRVFGS